MQSNKRRRTRVEAGFIICLHKDGVDAEAESHNLSMKGLLCDSVESFEVDDKCEVSITLSEEVRILISAKVVRADETGLAVDFCSMDEESFTHLRRLVQFNAEDADIIDDELTSPAFDL